MSNPVFLPQKIGFWSVHVGYLGVKPIWSKIVTALFSRVFSGLQLGAKWRWKRRKTKRRQRRGGPWTRLSWRRSFSGIKISLLCYIHIYTNYFIFLSWRLRDCRFQSALLLQARVLRSLHDRTMHFWVYNSYPTGNSTVMVSDLNVFYCSCCYIHMLLAYAAVTFRTVNTDSF